MQQKSLSAVQLRTVWTRSLTHSAKMTVPKRFQSWSALRRALQPYKELPQFRSLDIIKGDEHGFDDQTPLHIACYRGDKAAVCLMLDAGASTAVRGDIGSSPLHEAVLGESLEVVHVLLDHGADPNAVDDYGDTPLDVARSLDNPEIIELLSRVTKPPGAEG